MQGLPSILSFFRNEFDKFNNTASHIIGFIYHMALKSLKITFWPENIKIPPFYYTMFDVIT